MREKTPSRRERGQALILLALAFIGLAAFIGLTVDAGILFINVGHLRRAVDAASLGAASQFREGQSLDEITAAAREFILLNIPGSDPSTDVLVETCATNMGISPQCLEVPPRKLVKVTATMDVNFAFLPIIGWTDTPISANAISEAASLDLVLVIDTSASEAFDLCRDGDDDDGDGVADDCNGFPQSQVGTTSDADPTLCNPTGTCKPFEDVRAAALGLVGHMYFPYDRMSVITFSQTANEDIALNAGSDELAVIAAVNAMDVDSEPTGPTSTCPSGPVPNPTGCTSTNTAEGLQFAAAQFSNYGRPESVWIVIFLSDGGANAARASDGVTWICPGLDGQPTWIVPFCRDPVAATRHDASTDPDHYDTDDAARDWADLLGCKDDRFPTPPACAAAGDGATIFTIGLGELMTNSPACDPYYAGGCEADMGESLMRYIAGVGDDGDPATDPCLGPPVYPVGTSCGNYYFAPQGADLQKVFEAIASRIFTRISH